MKKQIYNYAKNIDKETLSQFEECYKQPFVVKAALMPDAHLGYVAPIGTVLITKDYIVPSWVGFDIGCGMTAVKITNKNILKKIKSNEKIIYEKVKKVVPMGLGKLNDSKRISLEIEKKLNNLIKTFESKPHKKDILNILKTNSIKNIGTLGHGNHFISLNHFNNKELWIIVHCGSRAIGHNLAERYMKISAKKNKQFEKTYPIHKSSIEGQEYLNLLDFGLEFALLNRLQIIDRIIKVLEEVTKEKIKSTIWVNKNHNHAIQEKSFFIHRKGATPAKKNERGVIPGNMRDGSFLVEGLGNAKFLNSSSHGAGRRLSRTQAKKTFTLEYLKKEMQGIYTEVDEKLLDESPEAYKNIFEVMEQQKKSVKVIKHLKPLINWQK
jgi:tRNA-splicing ligase RtcB